MALHFDIFRFPRLSTLINFAPRDVFELSFISKAMTPFHISDDAVAAFFYKNKKGKKPTAWKVNLEIGPDIKISTTGYVKVCIIQRY